MPNRKRKIVSDHRSDLLKDLSPRLSPPVHPRSLECPRVTEESGKESRDDAAQRGMEELY